MIPLFQVSADLEGKEANKLKVKISRDSPACSGFTPGDQLPARLPTDTRSPRAAPLGRHLSEAQADSTCQHRSVNAIKQRNRVIWGRRKQVAEQWKGNKKSVQEGGT